MSNDSPYSEAYFRTLEYCPVFPERFGSIAHARRFCGIFVKYYNHEHRHQGIRVCLVSHQVMFASL